EHKHDLLNQQTTNQTPDAYDDNNNNNNNNNLNLRLRNDDRGRAALDNRNNLLANDRLRRRALDLNRYDRGFV
ncbi:unnamed protein product, partial [Rotaria sordida]